jgi:hypothetical protein
MSDLNFQQFSSVQSDKQPLPVTMASAATVAPTTRFTRFTGATPITTVTPPVTGYHELVFVFTTATAGHLATGGNIATAWTSIADRTISLHYDPRTALYYLSTVL